jgi:phospholipid/cholesterol/gamma-HCH transport system substrate-binding protein
MNEQAIRFRFGIFVLASLILLAVLTILFGGFPNYFKRTQEYTIVFSNAAGVAPGTPVRRSGVRIGEVRTVVLNNETGKVDVEIIVEEKFTLRKVDRPTIMQGLIGGDAAIAFLPPEDSKLKDDITMIPPGATIAGISPPDASALLQNTQDLVGPAKDTLLDLRKILKGIDELRPVVDETLKSFRDIGQMTKTTGPEIQKTAEEIRLLAKTTRDMMPEIRRTNEELQFTVRTWGRVGERFDVLLKTNEDKIVRSIDRIDDTLKRVNLLFSDENIRAVNDTLKNVRSASGQLDSLSKDAGDLIKESRITVKQVAESLKRADEALADLQKTMKLFGDKGPQVLKNIDEAADSLNKTLKDVRELIHTIARSEGTVNKLIFDPSLYNNLNDSAEMVTKILPRLDRTLRDIETFADKLARHPELLGIPGIFRPSSGLKEAPSRPYHIFP